jgi:hypothetical protein
MASEYRTPLRQDSILLHLALGGPTARAAEFAPGGRIVVGCDESIQMRIWGDEGERSVAG